MQYAARNRQWALLEDNVFDVAIIGGGINGACLYHQLCTAGFSVLLLDKSDFAAGTSQASAMMVWGGLLYLRNFDLPSVRRLCRSRDRMLRDLAEWVKPCRFRYVPSGDGGLPPSLVHAALYLYWLIGGCQRRRPRREYDFPERSLLTTNLPHPSLVYEEACVEPSDARFVLQWLLSTQGDRQAALNYCGLTDAAFDRSSQTWRLDLHDTILARPGPARARWVVNAAGPWTDEINARHGLDSPYKHVLSKGVFITLRRDPRHQLPLIFPTRTDTDAMSLIPWGPVSLWGPTETPVESIADGFSATPADVRALLDELNHHLAHPVSPNDIISLRCGLRPLAVHRAFGGAFNSLDLSRRHRIHRDADRPWISVYGGKLTDCVATARATMALLKQSLPYNAAPPARTAGLQPSIPFDSYPSLDEPVPAPTWCAAAESCWTLDDYLRRRTNVSQWVARGGLGQTGEHRAHLLRVAQVLTRGDAAATNAVDAYERSMATAFDRTIASC